MSFNFQAYGKGRGRLPGRLGSADDSCSFEPVVLHTRL